MKLIVLTENCGGSIFLAEHGLSYLIEHEGKKVLFDIKPFFSKFDNRTNTKSRRLDN